MKANVYSLDGEVIEEIKLPSVFETEYRVDLIKRAVLASMSHRIQPWGPNPMSGKRASVRWPGKGRGLARTPRTRSGRGRAAFVPNAVGGRRAHPPKVYKIRSEKINKKERRLAIKSAISMSKDPEIVKERGHRIEEVKEIPLIVEDKFEEIWKASETKEVLENLGVWKDVLRAKKKKVRAGKGKMRGRKYKKKKGPLIVVSKKAEVEKGVRNHPGVDVVAVENLSAEHLAPGTHPGRLTLWTKSAILYLEGIR